MRVRIVILFLFIVLPVTSLAQVLFEDDFESGDLSSSGSIGFKWFAPNGTAVVDSAGVSWPNGSSISKPPTETWGGFSGDHSLLFNYPPGEFWSEHRFSMGIGREEIWLGYWLKVPENFFHSSNAPSNSKLLAIWMDGYSTKGDGATVAWEFWDAGGSGSSQLAVHYSTGNYTGAGSHLQFKPFINVPSDRGRWMHIVVHLQASSNITEADGIIETWRRWDGEPTYEKLHEIYDAVMPLPASGPPGWKYGYLMGWSNPGYTVETNWLVDSFTLASNPRNGWPRSGKEFPPKAPNAY